MNQPLFRPALSRAALSLTALAFTSFTLAAPALAQSVRGKYPPGTPRPGVTAPAAPATAAAPATVEQMLPLVREAFLRHDCTMALEGGELDIADEIAEQLGTTRAVVMDRDGPYYRAIDNAFDQMEDTGQFTMDRDAGVLRLSECLAPSEAPGAAPAQTGTEALIPLIRQSFARHACELPLADGEQVLAADLAELLGTTTEAVMDRNGPHYSAVGSALDQLRSSGMMSMDRDAGVIRFPNCDQ